MIGNEGSGMKDETKNMCDEFINIKMMDTCESLNAGVAASIIMYEVYHEWNDLYKEKQLVLLV